jgi:hypothetical protein
MTKASAGVNAATDAIHVTVIWQASSTIRPSTPRLSILRVSILPLTE